MRFSNTLPHNAWPAFTSGKNTTNNVAFRLIKYSPPLQWIKTVPFEMTKHIRNASGIRLPGGRLRKLLCGHANVVSQYEETAGLIAHLVIVFSLVGLCVSDCPDEWKSHKDFCFRLTEDKSETFNLAESLCRKLHPSAHLASIHSEEENDVAVIAARNITAWIGLQLVKERWRWSDRTYVDYTNWLEPKGPIGNDTGCVQLTMSKKWQGGISCKKSKKPEGEREEKITAKVKIKHKRTKRDRFYDFERSMRDAGDKDEKKRGKHGGKGKGQPSLCKVPHMETCGGPDWIRAGEFCYNFSMPGMGKSWTDAASYCLQMDARFVAIFNARQNDVLRRLSHLAGNAIWLGLIHTDDGFHRWADGAIMRYENFGPHDKYDAEHKCAFMDDETGLWQHELCTRPLDFVCMRPKLRLYDARTANNSRPRATVEIWRRIEEALVPARAPPRSKTSTTTAKPTPRVHAEMREEVVEAKEKITAGVMTDSGRSRGARSMASRRAAARRLRRRIRRHLAGHLT